MKTEQKEWIYSKSIKELKEGYISQAVHLITELMVQYQAIVVMEDLSVKFAEGYKTVEAPVYEKFENALISKLNYLVDKKLDVNLPGGALQAYQLTNDSKSFKKTGKQNGFLFYVSPWAVDKTDPATGYVCLLPTKYTNTKQIKEMIRKLKSIRYNHAAGYFEITYRDSDFSDRCVSKNTTWTICSHGERIIHFKNDKGLWNYTTVDITARIKKHLSAQGIDYTSDDLIEDICGIKDSSFFREFMYDIELITQMRNYGGDEHYLLSPVKNLEGRFFDTRYYDVGDIHSIPKEIDAIKTYNIAKKGLMLVDRIRNTTDKKVPLAISAKDWLVYAQANPLEYQL